MNFPTIQFQDFRAPKADEVCLGEPNHNAFILPEQERLTRREVKYHLTIVSRDFQFLYKYTIVREFAVNFQNCSFFQEADSLEVKIAHPGLA